MRRHEVHPCIGALCRKEHGDQQCVRIMMNERNRGIGKKPFENAADNHCFFFSVHFPTQNLEKIAERISSVMFVPMIIPNSVSTLRMSDEINSGEWFDCSPSITACIAMIALAKDW